MPKSKEVFICQNCGAASPKWQGQCPGCGGWNTLLAEISSPNPRKSAQLAHLPRADVSTTLAAEAHMEQPRLATGSAELDRVLGGGLVPGSVTLIGGDPGIGKSTLMLQAAAALQALGPVLYATGEESLKQVALRGRRLGLEAATTRLIAETCVEHIVGAASSLAARVLIVDSIQTMYSEGIDAAPGAVSQLRECTAELVRFESRRHRGAAGRPRHEGGADRRSQGARAHGRYRAVFRERYRQPLPGAALGEEPFWRRQRDRRIRHGRAGTARGHES